MFLLLLLLLLSFFLYLWSVVLYLLTHGSDLAASQVCLWYMYPIEHCWLVAYSGQKTTLSFGTSYTSNYNFTMWFNNTLINPDAWVDNPSANTASVTNTWVSGPNIMLPVRADFCCCVMADLICLLLKKWQTGHKTVKIHQDVGVGCSEPNCFGCVLLRAKRIVQDMVNLNYVSSFLIKTCTDMSRSDWLSWNWEYHISTTWGYQKLKSKGTRYGRSLQPPTYLFFLL